MLNHYQHDWVHSLAIRSFTKNMELQIRQLAKHGISHFRSATSLAIELHTSHFVFYYPARRCSIHMFLAVVAPSGQSMSSALMTTASVNTDPMTSSSRPRVQASLRGGDESER